MFLQLGVAINTDQNARTFQDRSAEHSSALSHARASECVTSTITHHARSVAGRMCSRSKLVQSMSRSADASPPHCMAVVQIDWNHISPLPLSSHSMNSLISFIPKDEKIYNVNTRGKRGNIVQVTSPSPSYLQNANEASSPGLPCRGV